MFLAYIDESGDDGFPTTSSSLFVLSALYMHHRTWKTSFESVQAFRRELARAGALPFDTELHTRELLLDKDPYHALKLPAAERMRLVRLFCERLVGLEVKLINVVINKPAIVKPDYQVLDTALTYLIQRVENDLRSSDAHAQIVELLELIRPRLNLKAAPADPFRIVCYPKK